MSVSQSPNPACPSLVSICYRLATEGSSPIPPGTRMAGKELSPLPQIFNQDKRIAKPEEYFKLPPRYKFSKLLGHGAYGLVW